MRIVPCASSRPCPTHSGMNTLGTAQARGMSVELVDANAHRIAKINGSLFREVSFGWGIIGHLKKGGHVCVQQADVGDGTWDITSMSLRTTGKIMMYKGISMISDQTFSDFRSVPDDLTFANGVTMLTNEQEKFAHNHEPEAAVEKKEPR